MKVVRRKRVVWVAAALLLLAAVVASFYWRPILQQLSRVKPGTVRSAQTSRVASSPAPPPPNSPQPRLAPVQLTPQRMQSIGVTLGTVEIKPVNDEIRVTGNVEVDERRLAYVQTRFPGWIRKVYVDANYQYIRKGQPLFTIYSPDLVTTEHEYLLAKQNAAALQASPIADVASGANSLLSAARARLEQWEVPATEIDHLEKTGRVITDLTFNSPATGYVTERNALPNMYVQPGTKLYTVADLSTVWVQAQVFQTDLGKVRFGESASVTVDAYPGRTFRGRVDLVYPQVDENTRTARVRLVFPNPGLKLTPGMYVNVVLKVPLGRQILVPSSSVFHSGMNTLVFLNRGGGQLEPRQVETGLTVGDETIILKGLKRGDSIVTSSNFLIDSESQLQAAASAFSPPAPGSGTAATAAPGGASQAKIELTTVPSPPTKGGNLFRVKLTTPEGKPLDGAQVTVTFYMPAMPAMGMAAMRTVVSCSGNGNGLYEGTGTLGSGGTWQVNVTAQQNGKTVAAKTLTMSAAGGM